MIYTAARIFRIGPHRITGVVRRLEGGSLVSRTLRRILWRERNIRAEAFSYGSFHVLGAAPPGMVIGRYASIANGVQRGHNHPTGRMAMSPVFYEPGWGITDRWTVDLPNLEICPDAWIGANVVIVGTCTRIGIGAVIGAGTVVTRDVPDFAVVVGVPGRVVRYRFPEDIQKLILASRWWEYSPRELGRFREIFAEDVSPETMRARIAELMDTLTASKSGASRVPAHRSALTGEPAKRPA